MWADQRNGHWDIYFATRPVTGTWSANARVNDDITGTLQASPAIAVDAGGNAYVTWEDQRDGDSDIYFATRSVTGTWSANVRVNDDITGTAHQASPSIAVDAVGNAHVAWEDERNGAADVYFATWPVTGTWSANAQVNDDAGAAIQDSPAIAVDSDGHAYAVWLD